MKQPPRQFRRARQNAPRRGYEYEMTLQDVLRGYTGDAGRHRVHLLLENNMELKMPTNMDTVESFLAVYGGQRVLLEDGVTVCRITGAAMSPFAPFESYAAKSTPASTADGQVAFRWTRA